MKGIMPLDVQIEGREQREVFKLSVVGGPYKIIVLSPNRTLDLGLGPDLDGFGTCELDQGLTIQKTQWWGDPWFR